jgi:hypothetical protein
MKDTELAYAAGILDGEGYVGMVYRKPGARLVRADYTLQTVIGMTHEPTIRWLCETFGFNFFRKEPRQAHHTVAFLASLQHKRAAEFLRLVQPYVRTKAEQVSLAIEFIDGLCEWRDKVGANRKRIPDDEQDRRHGYYSKLRDLNGRKRGDQSEPNSERAADLYPR